MTKILFWSYYIGVAVFFTSLNSSNLGWTQISSQTVFVAASSHKLSSHPFSCCLMWCSQTDSMWTHTSINTLTLSLHLSLVLLLPVLLSLQLISYYRLQRSKTSSLIFIEVQRMKRSTCQTQFRRLFLNLTFRKQSRH